MFQLYVKCDLYAEKLGKRPNASIEKTERAKKASTSDLLRSQIKSSARTFNILDAGAVRFIEKSTSITLRMQRADDAKQGGGSKNGERVSNSDENQQEGMFNNEATESN